MGLDKKDIKRETWTWKVRKIGSWLIGMGVKVGNMSRDHGLCVCGETYTKPHVLDEPLGETIL
jgi:hypothetical protein